MCAGVDSGQLGSAIRRLSKALMSERCGGVSIQPDGTAAVSVVTVARPREPCDRVPIGIHSATQVVRLKTQSGQRLALIPSRAVRMRAARMGAT